MDAALLGGVIGAAAAMLGGVIGGWVQGWARYRLELRRAEDESRRRWTELALERAGSGRLESLRRADL